MNQAQIYSQVVGRTEEEKPQSSEDIEQREQFEMNYLNWKMFPVTRDLLTKIQDRISDLNLQNLNLSTTVSESRNERIAINLIEIKTLTKILNYGKENNFTII